MYMKRSILFLGSLLIMSLATASCGDDGTDAKINFEDQTGYLPANMENWPHDLFLFDKSHCTEVEIAQNKTSLHSISDASGDRETILAYENADNLDFSRTKAGGYSEEYYLTVKNINNDIPQLWIKHRPLNQSDESISMQPLTSGIKVNLINAPTNLQNVSLDIPGLSDRLYLYSGKIGCSEKAQTKTISMTTADSGKQFNILPMANPDGNWTLNFSLKFSDTTLQESMDIPKGISTGQVLEVNIDLSKYTTESSYSVTYRYSTYNANQWTEQKSDFMRVLPGNDTYLNKNAYYNVFVLQNGQWKSVEVRNTLCSNSVGSKWGNMWRDWDNTKQLRDTICYTNFIDNFTGPVKIRIQKRNGKLNSYEVRPSSYSITPTPFGSNMIEFTLPSWEERKVSVEFNGDRYHNLFLLPNKPDTNNPGKSSTNVIYYGAGEHNVGEITLTANQTLYIDAGAVVYGNVVVKGDNVTITGRGILSGRKLRHWGGDTYSNGAIELNVSGVKNFTLSGITIEEGPSWTVALFNVDHPTIDNVNILDWILNGDGIDLCSVTNATVNNCFIRTTDDCISIKVTQGTWNETKTVNITNCTIWSDYARGIVMGPECGDWVQGMGGISYCTVDHCIVLEQPNGSDDCRSALAVGPWAVSGGGASQMTDITFSNILIDNIQSTGRPIWVYQYDKGNKSGELKRVIFKNINIRDTNGCKYPIAVQTNNNYLDGLTFDNVTYNGAKITGTGSHLTISGNVYNITYK
jgi:hypothetical protein